MGVAVGHRGDELVQEARGLLELELLVIAAGEHDTSEALGAIRNALLDDLSRMSFELRRATREGLTPADLEHAMEATLDGSLARKDAP